MSSQWAFLTGGSGGSAQVGGGAGGGISVSLDMLRLPKWPLLVPTPRCWAMAECEDAGTEDEGLGLFEGDLKRVGVWERIDESCELMEVTVTVNSEVSAWSCLRRSGDAGRRLKRL